MGCGESKHAGATTESLPSRRRLSFSFSKKGSSSSLKLPIMPLDQMHEVSNGGVADGTVMSSETSLHLNVQTDVKDDLSSSEVETTPRTVTEQDIVATMALFCRIRELVLQKVELQASY